jgi:probable F420-dependent oxidoreductase
MTRIGEVVRAAEAIGLDGLWTAETKHDPFLPLVLAAHESLRLQLGTSIAVAFGRSPATVAYTSWDLARMSGGRFILGLGTQVRAHVERRFGLEWPDSPTAKLREFVGAVRAFWRAWQQGENLNFRGDYYKLTLMTPFFNPGPIDHPDIPVYLAGVNAAMIRTIGEVGDGLHVHPLHTVEYLRRVVRPALEEGARRAGREGSGIGLAIPVFVVRDDEERQRVREAIAFYASTPNYRSVLEVHGWGEVGRLLSAKARGGRWENMADEIDDEMKRSPSSPRRSGWVRRCVSGTTAWRNASACTAGSTLASTPRRGRHW